jgi:hypothetical protein
MGELGPLGERWLCRWVWRPCDEAGRHMSSLPRPLFDDFASVLAFILWAAFVFGA